MYYFDNSATTLRKPISVATAVYDALANEQIGNPARGSHDPALYALRKVEKTREQAARLFGVQDTSHVSFLSNATTALNTVIRSLLNPDDHIITTVTEHNAVLRPLYQLEQKGAQLSYVPINKEGQLNYTAFEKLLRSNTRAVVVNHASNVTGNVANLEWIGQFCHKHHLLFIVDAAQSAGIIEIDMEKQQIDALCFTGHKSLYGPQGTGGICIGSQVKEWRPVFTGGSGFRSSDKAFPSDLPGAFEPGTQNVHGLAGLKAGLDYVEDTGISVVHKQTNALATNFIRRVESIPGILLYGCSAESSVNSKRVPVVSLNLEGWSSGDLSEALQMDFAIAVRPGMHCAPLIHHAFGTEKKGMVRFSFSTFTNQSEIDIAVQALETLAAE
ncbi:MAG: aminotransferase class V-fold PLP-dependent enzyme [Pisciglobus halotolerans]|nr:aminotransferase class V-fold PLP-dependent enzyme [Pisciglobus halotolerans]